MDDRTELLEILRRNSLLKGHFVLASGKESDYYLDCKLTTLSNPRGLKLACLLLFDRIRLLKRQVNAIGGLTIGAAPLVVGVSQVALREGWNLPVFIVRDEQKSHGTQRVIEGTLKAGWGVVIIDDVMTTGNSVMKAIKAAEKEGAKIVKVFVLIDREEGGLEALHDYEIESVFSYKELLTS